LVGQRLAGAVGEGGRVDVEGVLLGISVELAGAGLVVFGGAVAALKHSAFTEKDKLQIKIENRCIGW